MKLKHLLKIGLPFVMVSSTITGLELTLTSCDNAKKESGVVEDDKENTLPPFQPPYGDDANATLPPFQLPYGEGDDFLLPQWRLPYDDSDDYDLPQLQPPYPDGSIEDLPDLINQF